MSLQQRTARAPSSGCNILKLDFTRVMLSSSLVTSLVAQRRFGDAEHLQGAALFRSHVRRENNEISWRQTTSQIATSQSAVLQNQFRKRVFFSLLRPSHSVAAAEFRRLAASRPQRQGANTDGCSVIFISIFMNSPADRRSTKRCSVNVRVYSSPALGHK